MASLQKTVTQAVGQLRDMTVSQRLAILLGVALVAGSLVWLAQWAAQPEMVPLLDQSLGAEDLALVQGGLDALGQKYRVEGSRVLVPASADRQSVLARLQQQDKLPGDTSIGFGALVKESNPWISQEENERRWTVALQSELARVLSNFGEVKRASVHLPLGRRRGVFSRNIPLPSASVTLTMQGGEPVSRQLALAAARLVSGAVPALSLKNVNVVDGAGVSVWPGPDAEPGGSGELDRRRREHEVRIAEKIRSQLAFDPKVRVNVQVMLDRTARELESSTPTEGVEIIEERETDETKRGQRSSEPGVKPNVGVAAGAGGLSESSLRESTKVEKLAGTTRKVEHTPPGEIQEIFAAINVSHSYLEGVYRRNNPETDPPTEAQVQAVFENEKTKIVNQVAVLVKPQTDEQVRVDWYYDSVDAGVAAEAGSFETSVELVQRFGPASALALLALLSLALVMRMARRGDSGESFGLDIGLPKKAIAAAKKAAEDVQAVAGRSQYATGGRGPGGRPAAPTSGTTGEPGEPFATAIPMPTGEAAVTEGILDAQEVDESAVQIVGMLDQVTTMINEDPEGTAVMIERWVQRSD